MLLESRVFMQELMSSRVLAPVIACVAGAFAMGTALATLSASAAQDGNLPRLDALTLAASALPTGCVVAPPAARTADGKVSRGWSGLPLPTNPWSGSDRAVIAAIRHRLDPPPVVPDGPPLHPREMATFRSNAADGVEQAYAAVYESGDQQQVLVAAVQFGSDYSLTQAVARSARRLTRYTTGRTLIAVEGQKNACSTALDAHVRSVIRQ